MSQPPRPRAVTITVPAQPAFALASLHDVQVRVGSVLPGSGATAVDQVNAVCASRTGNLASSRGQAVRLKCALPQTAGQYMTVHIRWGGSGAGSRRRRQWHATRRLAQCQLSYARPAGHPLALRIAARCCRSKASATDVLSVAEVAVQVA